MKVDINDRHEISFILTFKRITSVNEAYKAKISYIGGKPIAQIYKSAETKEFQRRIEEQLQTIDFKRIAPWIWTAKTFNLTFQSTFNHGYFARDLDNLVKACQDQIFKHLELNDSRVIELHGWKTIMPDSPEELICVKLSESDFDYEIKGKSSDPVKKKIPKIFLGGTCSGENWRKPLITELRKEGIKYFNPLVENWTQECIENEEKEKNNKCDFLLYVITKDIKGPYSLAEAVDSAYKSKEGTDKKVLLYVDSDGFTENELKSYKATVDLVNRVGKVNIKAVIESGKNELMNYIKELLNL